MENVVATRRGPVLVDTESVMQPIRARAKESQPGNVKSDADDPCLATGLVTFGEMGADGGNSFCIVSSSAGPSSRRPCTCSRSRT